MKRIIIITGLGLVILVIAVVVYFWYVAKKPLYQPGMVRAGGNLRAPLTPPEQAGDDEFWQVEEDVRLYHFSVGEGKNVLIVHGGPGFPNRKSWSGLEPLTDDYQFHYYDQRGCGKSTRPIDTFSSPNYYENVTTLDQTLGLGAQIADIERIRQILGDEKLIIIGHSWGGLLASLYAAEFPEHVEALILVSPADALVMSKDQGGGLFEEVRKRLPENMKADFDAYLKDYFDYGNIFDKSEADLVAANEEFGKYFVVAIEAAVPEQGEQDEAGGWMVHAMYFSMGLQHDYRDAMKDVTAPVLVIHGADDFQTEQVSHIYVDAFPNARFHVIENAGHSSFSDQPMEFATVLDNFLNELR